MKDCFNKGLLRNVELDPEIIDKELQNAKKHIDNARFCLKGKKYDLAVVSIYTSMFHAGRCLLFKDGIKERSHVCVIIYLKETYPELYDHLKVFDGYRKSRHTMLYGIEVEAVLDDAVEGIEKAQEFIEAVTKLLK